MAPAAGIRVLFCCFPFLASAAPYASEALRRLTKLSALRSACQIRTGCLLDAAAVGSSALVPQDAATHNTHERILTLFLTSCGLSPMCARGFRIQTRSLLDAPAFHAAQALPRKDPRTIFCGLFCCSSVRLHASMAPGSVRATNARSVLKGDQAFVCRSTPRLAGGQFIVAQKASSFHANPSQPVCLPFPTGSPGWTSVL